MKKAARRRGAAGGIIHLASFLAISFFFRYTKSMKFISWNIDSLNAALTGTSPRSELTRDVIKKIAAQNADFIAIQETKLGEAGLLPAHKSALAAYFPDYDYAYVSSVPPAKKGYAGTISFYKKGLAVQADFPKIGAPDTMDSEGRIIALETDAFYFVQVYTPNSGDGLKRLGERQVWDKKYADYLSGLDEKKPVIACGDFNVAHTEIDLANPDSNHFSAGFTDEERAGFTALLGRGFVDTFRKVHGEVKGAYSWWSQRITTAKANNAGWRIDYFLASERIAPKVSRSEIMDSGARPDHAPLLMEIDL